MGRSGLRALDGSAARGHGRRCHQDRSAGFWRFGSSGRPVSSGRTSHREERALYVPQLHKRGVTLDVGKAEGKRIFRELVADADVLIESHSPGVVEELGLTYDDLKPQNPKLVMVSISPFGQTGPYRDYVGSELVLFHMGGIGYETPAGDVTNPEREPPLKGRGTRATSSQAGWPPPAHSSASITER